MSTAEIQNRLFKGYDFSDKLEQKGNKYHYAAAALYEFLEYLSGEREDLELLEQMIEAFIENKTLTEIVEQKSL